MTQYFRGSGRTLLALTTGIALVIAAPALASPRNDPGKNMKGGPHACMHHGKKMSRLVVSGQGEARVAPDLAEIQLGVTSQAESAAEAMQQNSEQQGAVIDALKEAGIEAANIQTSGLRLNPRMEYPENGAPTINGYEASNMVTIRVTDVSILGEVLDSIVAAGANQIQGINFQRDDAEETGDEALRSAVEDARRKAEVMAEAAGMRLGPVIALRDMPAVGGPEPMMMRAEAARGAATPIEAGELSLSAQVQVEYALIGDKGSKDCGPDLADDPDQAGEEAPENEMPDDTMPDDTAPESSETN
ncbi:SIMPL domain-containing protein [Paracoccus onubensis]|uniref:SIMPL domain-containing protein n=1 Tax=Paracoccus onubensis TaxID=1675788 RepID=UPI002730204A|nr:SIMPL domain-containing protein [Paracoccus onubensis]MDP0927227.1 SIMPL domain-containing protein [Paracoccus onubensis]